MPDKDGEKKPKATTYVTTHTLKEELQNLHDDLKGHFRDLRDEIRHSRQAEAHDTNNITGQLEKLLMATQAEQAQVDRIDAAVQQIRTETQGTSQKLLDLMAQHGVDQATIDGMETDVVNLLSPVADRAEALAKDLADPSTPLSPTS